MKAAIFNSPHWSTRTGQLMSDCLQTCKYHEDLVENDFSLATDHKLPLTTFAHRPHDARSSCMVFLPFSDRHDEDANALRPLGPPLIFFVKDTRWEVWSLRADGARRVRSLKESEVKNYFEKNKEDFAPGSIFRAKTWARATGARQLEFVDTNLLPWVEHEAGLSLGRLFEKMVNHTMDVLKIKSAKMTDAEGHWLMKANFWLLAGKLLRDKKVSTFNDLELLRVDEVFERVAEHYGSQPISTSGKITALRGAAKIADSFGSLVCISTETLGSLYEEAMVSKLTRKLLSIHRTPTYLVDYMIARLSDWIENDIDIRKCHVFEPACGHAPFLVGAMRMLSDLLPSHIASDRLERRNFLRKHISGCDRDGFALEIARLSLTLADIPNPNRWNLDSVGNMFTGDDLDTRFGKASVVFVNPPFEKTPITAAERRAGDLRYQRNGQAAELLRRLLRSAQPGTVLGVVVPQTILESDWFLQLRRDLMTRCEIREISVFSDKVFSFADVETAIILARVKRPRKPAALSFTFRRVRDSDVKRFAKDYYASATVEVNVARIEDDERFQLLVAELPRVWKALEGFPKFSSIATIGNGFLFLSPGHKDYPTGEIKIAAEEKDGFVEGFAKIADSPDSHLLPALVWLNQKPEMIAAERSGIQRDSPQILLNHVRVSRKAWRLRAFLDALGRPATDAFLLVRPIDSRWTLQSIWALCNSPIANAYDYAHSAKKHVVSGFLSEMPVPDLSKSTTEQLTEAVRTYFLAAKGVSDRMLREKAKPQRTTEKQKGHAADNQLLLLDIDVPSVHDFSAELEQLRALHWRIDAEVLRLYSLPARIERELLNYFDDTERVGVPFSQTRYIPRELEDIHRLDDFLRITAEWQATDERRYELIGKELVAIISAEEQLELEDLQRLLELREAWEEYQNPIDLSELDAALAEMRAEFKKPK